MRPNIQETLKLSQHRFEKLRYPKSFDIKGASNGMHANGHYI
jgi:hypothetical protein